MIAAREMLFLGLLAMALVPAVVIDLSERRIPNWATAIVAGLGLARAWLRGGGHGVEVALVQALVTAVLLGGSVWLLGRLRAGARLGMGDLKLLVAAAVWIGWDGSVAMLGLASLLALLAALAEAPWRGLDLGRMRPFAPMLAGAMLAIMALAAFAPVGR